MSYGFTAIDEQRPSHEQLLDLVAAELGIPRDDISAESCFAGDLGLEPWDLFELIQQLEAVFQTRIDDAVVERLQSVSDLARALESAAGPASIRSAA